MTIKHTSHARYDLWYHIVFSTKYRKRVWLDEPVKIHIKQMFRDIASHYDLTIGTIEVLSDHVHFTLSAPPRLAPARAVQILKSVSTKLLFQNYPWLRKEYWGGQIWIAGYFIRSIGEGITLAMINKYIAEQVEEI